MKNPAERASQSDPASSTTCQKVTTKPATVATTKKTGKAKSVHQLEDECDELSKKEKKTTADIQKIKLLTHQSKLQAANNQAKVFELEKENNRQLIFFQSTSGYYEIIGNSVVFYIKRVINRIKWRYSRNNDTKNKHASETGFISFARSTMPKLTEKLLENGLVKNEAESNENIIIFDFPTGLDRDRIRELTEQVLSDERALHQILLPHDPVPNLFLKLEKIVQHLHRAFCKRSEFVRHCYGEPMMELATHMLMTYSRYARGPEEYIKGKFDENKARRYMAAAIYEDTCEFKSRIQVIVSSGAVNFIGVYDLGQEVNDVMKICKNIMKSKGKIEGELKLEPRS